MPFIGVRGDRPILPLEVADDGFVWCPSCEAKMKVREGDEVARHFYHVSGDSECGGESATHVEMKHIAGQKLLERYPDADVTPEQSMVDGQRRADIRVLFAEPDSKLGRGIAVEVQHHHQRKSVKDVTEDYLRSGYSVLWLSEADYEGTHPGYDDVRLTDPVPVWPFAFPQPIEKAPQTSEVADWSVRVDEQDLAVYLGDTQIGQQTLAEFEGDEDTSESESREATWALERKVSLSLAPEDNATGELVTDIFRRLLSEWAGERNWIEEVRDYQAAAAAADRNCYLDEWFSGEERDSFSIEVLVTPTGEPVTVSVETRRVGEALTVPIDPGFHDVFTELVLTACTELAFVSERTPQTPGGQNIWSHKLTTGAQPISCTITRTHEESVVVSLQQSRTRGTPATAVSVRFLPPDIQGLLELCTRLRIHTETIDALP